jgi:sugar phosphate isomerase/epimerase
MTTTSNSNILLGTSLFSFTVEWLSRRYTLDQMIERVAELGVGPGLEIVGFQSIRGYPAIPDEFAVHFRALVERLGLKPTALGANIDVGRYTGRLLTMEETVASVERQLEAARKLGFPLLRIQLVGAEVLEKLLPLAERAQIHLACEVHAPLTPSHPSVMVVRELCDRTQSPYLGLVLDFSASMTKPPAGYWHRLRQMGASEKLLTTANRIWQGDGAVPEKFAALAGAGQENNADPGVMGMLNMVMTMFAHMPVEAWREGLPYSRHLHGKFYHVDESGNEPAIPYPQIIALLKESGFSGSISAECEGSAFMDVADAVQDAEFGEVQRWHAMVRRLLEA